MDELHGKMTNAGRIMQSFIKLSSILISEVRGSQFILRQKKELTESNLWTRFMAIQVKAGMIMYNFIKFSGLSLIR